MEVTELSNTEIMGGRKKTAEKPNKTAAAEKLAEETTIVSSPESDRSGSPEPNCAICLGKLQNKSFTDSCFHMFCFTCLLEWAKVKAVCPLCKQAFKSIIHNVRSNQEYDQYHLRPEDTGSPEDARFRYRTTLTTDRWMFRQQMEQQRQLRMLQRPTLATTQTRSQWRRLRQAATSAFRQRVYTQNMWVRNLSHPPNRPPRYRNISVAFFKRNPAASHRLVPWLNRELNVILHNREDHVHFVLELIMDLIKRYEIQGEEFLEHMRSFMNQRSEHFVHEFYNFARSPYDMVAYDSHAIYDEPEPHVHSIESDSSSDDDDVILVSPSNRDYQNSGEPTFSNPEPPNAGAVASGLSPLLSRVRDFLAFIDTSQIGVGGWDSPLPGPSSSNLRWSPVTAPFSEIVGERSQAGQSSFQGLFPSSRPINVDLSPNEQSEEDDVMIVSIEKAWNRRTPIQLSSDEESSPEKYKSPSPTKTKHWKNHVRDRHERSKGKSSSHKTDRRTLQSHSSERHTSKRHTQESSTSCHRSRSRGSRDRHHDDGHERGETQERGERDYSPGRRVISITSKRRHFRFSSTSPSRKRSRRSVSSEVSKPSGSKSGRRRSRSSERHGNARSSRSPQGHREYCHSPEYYFDYGSRRQDRRDHDRHLESSSSSVHRSGTSRRDKDDNNDRRRSDSRSCEISIGSRTSSSRTESKNKHRRYSISSIETIYEKSHSSEEKPKRKHKKHKHKSKDKERRATVINSDSSSGVEIVEISEENKSDAGKSESNSDKDRGQRCNHRDKDQRDEDRRDKDGDRHQWKKHPTGHKKSSKSKSEGHRSDGHKSGGHKSGARRSDGHKSDSSGESSRGHNERNSDAISINSVELIAEIGAGASNSSSTRDSSKWKPLGEVEVEGGSKESEERPAQSSEQVDSTSSDPCTSRDPCTSSDPCTREHSQMETSEVQENSKNKDNAHSPDSQYTDTIDTPDSGYISKDLSMDTADASSSENTDTSCTPGSIIKDTKATPESQSIDIKNLDSSASHAQDSQNMDVIATDAENEDTADTPSSSMDTDDGGAPESRTPARKNSTYIKFTSDDSLDDKPNNSEELQNHNSQELKNGDKTLCNGESTSKSDFNFANQTDSLDEIEKTLRANILKRLSNSKSLHCDTHPLPVDRV